jgi:hypothetical protein
MNLLLSSSFNSNEQEQSVTNLVKIHSLTQLLKRDREQLSTQSRSIAYYHPNIDREKAEQLLRAKYTRYKRDGLFLLRDCTTSPHDFSLSLVYGDKCYHYKIQLIYDIYFSIGMLNYYLELNFYFFNRLRSTNSRYRKFN